MEHLEGILNLVDNELDAIVKNGKFRSREEIDSVYKLVDIKKDVFCIWDMESGSPDDGGASYGYGMHPYGMSYGDGDRYSYARGRMNARRDSMGRYASRGGNSYRSYGSGDKHEYISSLREMAANAPDEQTRMSINRMIEDMERQ